MIETPGKKGERGSSSRVTKGLKRQRKEGIEGEKEEERVIGDQRGRAHVYVRSKASVICEYTISRSHGTEAGCRVISYSAE